MKSIKIFKESDFLKFDIERTFGILKEKTRKNEFLKIRFNVGLMKKLIKSLKAHQCIGIYIKQDGKGFAHSNKRVIAGMLISSFDDYDEGLKK